MVISLVCMNFFLQANPFTMGNTLLCEFEYVILHYYVCSTEETICPD